MLRGYGLKTENCALDVGLWWDKWRSQIYVWHWFVTNDTSAKEVLEHVEYSLLVAMDTTQVFCDVRGTFRFYHLQVRLWTEPVMAVLPRGWFRKICRSVLCMIVSIIDFMQARSVGHECFIYQCVCRFEGVVWDSKTWLHASDGTSVWRRCFTLWQVFKRHACEMEAEKNLVRRNTCITISHSRRESEETFLCGNEILRLRRGTLKAAVSHPPTTTMWFQT